MEITIGKAGLVKVNGESNTWDILSQIIKEHKLDGYVRKGIGGSIMYESGREAVKLDPYTWQDIIRVEGIDIAIVMLRGVLVQMQKLDAEAGPKNSSTKRYKVDLYKCTYKEER